MTDFALQPQQPEDEPPTQAVVGDDVPPALELVPAPPVAVAGLFAPLSVNGKDVDLTHLHGFSFSFDTAKRTGVRCFVTFSTHCFSDKYDPDRHPTHVPVFDDRGVERCFDQDRYDLSKGLCALLSGGCQAN